MFKVIVDADACPVMNIINDLVIIYNLDVTYVSDTTHNISVDYGLVITVDKGSDSADYKILEQTNKHDIIVTQDYALASLILSKQAIVVHPNGFIIDNNNIDSLLNSRYLNQKARKAKIRTINPKKRKEEDNLAFKVLFKQTIIKQLTLNITN